MIHLRAIWLALCASLLAGSLAERASAEALGAERIVSYDADITVHADATMTVTETIDVVALGRNIRRGIYRDFPTSYLDRYTNRVNVTFELLGTTRNGAPERNRLAGQSNGVRVYIGDPERLVAKGRHSYTITYRTNYQIGYFDDHDELYWNVTGNGWDFAIEAASATVRLPDTAFDLTMEGYTGPAGASGQDYEAGTSAREGRIETTRPLSPYEGLTLAMTWPKGVVYEPTPAERRARFLRDNLGVLAALITLVLTAVYVFVLWRKRGRDPDPGVIIAQYEPPENYSPASARYIMKMGYDKETMSAAIVNLAVKGHVHIHHQHDEYTLTRQDSDQSLAPGERALLARLFGSGNALKLDQQEHATLQKARKAHKRALRLDYQNTHFLKNTSTLLPSIVATFLIAAAVVFFAVLTPAAIAIFGLNLALHFLYAYLMKAPTEVGREVMDHLEGFRLYLDVAEKDDLNRALPPERTPELFERYLPFAIALGVEDGWSKQFTALFARLDRDADTRYRPSWYHGHFNPMRTHSFASAMGSGFSNAISAAASPPGSSSGAGGGGSSGGGGGGGGGGGW